MSLLDPMFIEHATNLCMCGMSSGVKYYRHRNGDCIYLWNPQRNAYEVSHNGVEADEGLESYLPEDFGISRHWVPYGLKAELRDKLSALLFL